MKSLRGALKNATTKPTVQPLQNQWQQKWAANSPTVTDPMGAALPTNAESDLAGAYVTPADYNTGSSTNAGVRPNGQALKAATGYGHVAGHLVNNHLGGSGHSMANIATFSHHDNMDHKTTEAPAKALVSGGSNIVYWTVIKERADYTVNGYSVRNAASKMEAGWFNETTGVKGPVNVYKIGPCGNTAGWAAAPAISKQKNTGVDGLDKASGRGPALPASLSWLATIGGMGYVNLLNWEAQLEAHTLGLYDQFLSELEYYWQLKQPNPMRITTVGAAAADKTVGAVLPAAANSYDSWRDKFLKDTLG